MDKKDPTIKVLVRLVLYFLLITYMIVDISWDGPISQAITEKQQSLNEIRSKREQGAVAKVYGQFITKEDLNTAFRDHLFLSGKTEESFSPEALKTERLLVLLKMVDHTLLRYITSINDTRRPVSEAQSDREWTNFSSRFDSTEELDAALVDRKSNSRAMKWLLEARLAQEAQINANISEGLIPTEEELRETYNSLKAEYTPASYRECSHIFISSLHKTKEELDALINKVKTALEEGADFSELAKQFSEDTHTASLGGYLGDISDTRPLPGDLGEILFTDLPEKENPFLFHAPHGVSFIKAGKKVTQSLPDFDTLRPELETAIISLRKGTLVDLYFKNIRQDPLQKGRIELYHQNI